MFFHSVDTPILLANSVSVALVLTPTDTERVVKTALAIYQDLADLGQKNDNNQNNHIERDNGYSRDDKERPLAASSTASTRIL